MHGASDTLRRAAAMLPSALRLPLREPRLLLFLASRLASGTAQSLLRATIAWHVYELSGSAAALGLVGLVQFLPALALGLVAGVVADTRDRKRIVVAAQVVSFACGAGVWLMCRAEAVSLPLLYGAVLVIASAAAFENPARSALLPRLVEREDFPQAVNLTSAVAAFAFMSGPMATGFTIDAGGLAAAYALYLGLMVVAFTTFAAIGNPPAEARAQGFRLQLIREGLWFVLRHRVVLGCMTLDMFAVLLGGATALLPIYANDILHVGARGYGLLAAGLDLGALVMAAVMLLLPPIRRQGRWLLGAVVVFGLATVVFGLSRSFPLSLAAYMAAGMADYVSQVIRGTVVQLETPDAFRGRVSSVNFIFIGASNQLGAAESGFVAALTNPVFAVVSGGIGALLVTAAVAAWLPELRRYRVPARDPGA